MKKLTLTIITMLLLAAQPILAESISLKFNRTGTDASSVTVTVTDANGAAVSGASATLTSASHAFKATAGNVTSSILCPNINATANPTIDLVFTVSGVPAGFAFDKLSCHIHALNGGNSYQDPADNVVRKWNVAATVNNASFGSLSDIDIAAGITGCNKLWDITGSTVSSNGTVTVKLTVTKGSENGGCFFGLSEIVLSNAGTTPEPEPEPEPEPDNSEGSVYYISWKNTGANFITEESDHRMTVQGKGAAKQLWKFIPTGNDNCYYIKNTATGRYIGSCNLTPSSDSKIHTSETPVEYYVFQPSGTSGENLGCWYLSSTDCDNYSDASKDPCALNKDGASDYVITWTAKVENKGSYWKLIDELEVYSPFSASEAIGTIGTSYNMATPGGKYLTITDAGLALNDPDSFDKTQEWYFVGTGNKTGWQIASASKPATVIGIQDGDITAAENLDTKWVAYESKEVKGYTYFKNGSTTLKFGEDSLFRFNKVLSEFVRNLKIYNNPCGAVGNNYAKSISIHGEGALDNIIYTAESKPGKWHVMYANDRGAVAKGKKFDIDVTLSANAASDLAVTAHFDWNSDGVYETEEPLTLNGTAANAEVTVPEWANMVQTRMRLRVNSNGLDLAEDEVYGFIYDFNINVVEPQEERTVTIGVNSWERGDATLSEVADSYAYGATLTAKAIAYGNGTFVCWREEGVVVSTNAEYTFTADHNVKLVAYFAPNTDESSYPTGIGEVAEECVIDVCRQGDRLAANSASGVCSLELYTINAAKIAACKGNTMNVAGVAEGVYILRATTAEGYKNMKIFIKK
ncbi:MAG: hypothetical protein IJY44_08135 [Bacteroidaceae bacterium]|nr:hypothetical protein [Bacteroidaceae bacterium]